MAGSRTEISEVGDNKTQYIETDSLVVTFDVVPCNTGHGAVYLNLVPPLFCHSRRSTRVDLHLDQTAHRLLSSFLHFFR